MSDDLTVGALPRPKVSALGAVLGTEFPVGGEGFIRVLDYMGSDTAVGETALAHRMGVQKGKSMRELIQHLTLYENMAPFNEYVIKFHVKLPIYAARRWLRLRTQPLKEIDRRYDVLEEEFFLPSLHDWLRSGENEEGLETAALALIKLKAEALDVLQDYAGVHPLQVLPNLRPIEFPSQTDHVQWRWKVNLTSLLHFLHPDVGAANDPDIKGYGEVLQRIMQLWMPEVWKAYLVQADRGIYLTQRDRIIVQKLLAQNSNVSQLDFSISDLDFLDGGERGEILVKLRSLGFKSDSPEPH